VRCAVSSAVFASPVHVVPSAVRVGVTRPLAGVSSAVSRVEASSSVLRVKRGCSAVLERLALLGALLAVGSRSVSGAFFAVVDASRGLSFLAVVRDCGVLSRRRVAAVVFTTSRERSSVSGRRGDASAIPPGAVVRNARPDIVVPSATVVLVLGAAHVVAPVANSVSVALKHVRVSVARVTRRS